MKLSVKLVETFWQRFFGLMFKRQCEHPLLFRKCSAVHTFWMIFAIDLICLDAADNVIAVVRNIPPWRIYFAPHGTKSVLEAERDMLHQVSVGDTLAFVFIQEND